MPAVSENIFTLICELGILQGFLLAALLYFHPRSDKSVNAFLALHILFISLAMTMPFTIRYITWQRGNFMQPVLLLPAMFLYFYVRSFKERMTLKKLSPHLIVFILFSALVFWDTSLISSKYKNAESPPKEVFYEPLNVIVPITQMIIKICYYLLARRAIISYQKSIQQLFSETSRINLRWAKALTTCYLILVLVGVVMLTLIFKYPQHFNLLLTIYEMMGTPYIYFATYKGISQLTIWKLQPNTTKEEVEEKFLNAEKVKDEKNNVTVKPSKTTIDENKIEETVKRIISLMENEKIYQETELTLQQLADKLQLPSYQVSQVINDGLKKSFYDLVNGYRVEKAKNLLLDPKSINYTVLSVGFEAGFNSKTTFNTVFKKFTGSTPTEYRSKQKAEMAML